MITFPNAKINLGLRVVAKRTDGYHELQTVFYPVKALADALEITPAKDLSLTVTGNAVDCPAEKNLVMRAYRALQSRYALPPVALHLHKAIPDGAGLGGGSADAAFTLKMLNDIFSLGIDDAQLAAIAATLGADCAFFIYNRPMYATGIGDVLTPIDVDLAGKHIVMVKPAESVSTKQAYSLVTPATPDSDLRQILALPPAAWDGLLVNDFEPSVFSQLPQLWNIKIRLLQAGADYAAMSGSGSVVFGIFGSDKLAEQAADTFTDYATYCLPL